MFALLPIITSFQLSYFLCPLIYTQLVFHSLFLFWHHYCYYFFSICLPLPPLIWAICFALCFIPVFWTGLAISDDYTAGKSFISMFSQ